MIHRERVLRVQSGQALSKETVTVLGKIKGLVLHTIDRKNASRQPALRQNKALLQPDAARAAGGRSAAAAGFSFHGA
ncbi:hypothetical protein [Xanthomonas populi]|uniref:hypothetical protein n=1 Tax=Xanthomonas populi TaxID=53414 RepID=UPI000FF888DB|nr:hypothetical protein [Xanthomonas populi]